MVAGGTLWSADGLAPSLLRRFCCIANGAYLGFGSFDGVGDCGELLKHGASLWQLWLFGITGLGGGLALWNGLGPHFGIGSKAVPIDLRAIVGLAALAVGLAIVGILFGS